MSAITVGGDLVHYEVLGRGGRPVILLHGWFGSWRYWIPTMRQLQLKFRVYAIDLFGYGDSSKNPEKYSIESQMRLLSEFMQQLGIPKAAFIGHGLGAQVITEFAFRNPDRVARLLISSAPLFSVPDLETRQPQVERRVLLTNNANANNKPAREPLADKSTINPDDVQDSADGIDAPTIPSVSSEQMRNQVDREKLRQAAMAQGTPIIRNAEHVEPTKSNAAPRRDANRLLVEALSGGPEALLARSFRRSEPQFDKLLPDVLRSDARVIQSSTRSFDAGVMLDRLRLLTIPTVIVHGEDDPVIKAPDEQVWHYLTETKEDLLLPVPLPGVRHFPMLETETFQRLMTQFLENPDISSIEVKERWRRRAR
jgi:pimeloyl-ACP methyl ester carboxylesterase